MTKPSPACTPAEVQSDLDCLWSLWMREERFLRWYAAQLAARSGGQADDLLEDALLRATAAAQRGAGPKRQTRAWLKTLLDRTCVDQHRRRRFENFGQDEALDTLPNAWPNPESALLSREESLRMTGRLDTLPAAWRKPLELRVLEGYSYEKIARKLCISSSNARKRVQLARNVLRYGTPSGDRGQAPSSARNSMRDGEAGS